MSNLLAGINKIGKDKILLMAMAGIVLIICSKMDKNQNYDKKNGIELYSQHKNISDYISVTESKLEDMISNIEGVGKCKVMITVKAKENIKTATFSSAETIPSIEGILVITNGADNPIISAKINEVIQALFDIEMHKISIVEMK